MDKKEKVLKYIKNHMVTDNFKIACSLDMKIEEVDEILDELEKEHVIETF